MCWCYSVGVTYRSSPLANTAGTQAVYAVRSHNLDVVRLHRTAIVGAGTYRFIYLVVNVRLQKFGVLGHLQELYNILIQQNINLVLAGVFLYSLLS